MPTSPYGIIKGDCRLVLDELIAQGIKYDLILTDPPYNIGKDFGNDSDRLPLGLYLKSMYGVIDKLSLLLTDFGSLVWFSIHDYVGYFQVHMYEAGLSYRRMNIWHYLNGFSRSANVPTAQYEPFLWFSKDSSHWTYNANEIRVPYRSSARLKNPIKYRDSKGNVKIWQPSEKGALHGDVWEYPTLAGSPFAQERTAHPSQKPLSLFTDILRALCPMRNGLFSGAVLDPFLGVGTTALSCETLNGSGSAIKWTGIEIESRWCEIAQQRINALSV